MSLAREEIPPFQVRMPTRPPRERRLAPPNINDTPNPPIDMAPVLAKCGVALRGDALDPLLLADSPVGADDELISEQGRPLAT